MPDVRPLWMRRNHAFLIGCLAVVGLLFLAPVAFVLLRETFSQEPAPSVEVRGSPPVSSFLTTFRDGSPVGLIVTIEPGARLSDAAEMCLFGAFPAGVTAESFVATKGQTAYRHGDFLVQPQLEQHQGGKHGHYIPVVYASPVPEAAAYPLSHFFHPSIAAHLARIRYTGSFYLSCADRSGGLSVDVEGGIRLIRLRWHGAA